MTRVSLPNRYIVGRYMERNAQIGLRKPRDHELADPVVTIRDGQIAVAAASPAATAAQGLVGAAGV